MNSLLNNSSMLAMVIRMAADMPASPATPPEEPVSIQKPPPESKLARFKSKNLTPEKVETRLPGLPHYPISDANDWVRLHSNETEYWSDELCFVNIPVPGQKKDTLHLLDSDLAKELPPKRVLKFRLALGSKPHDNFFFAHVPSQNLDNKWNETNLQGCEQAKRFWTTVTSLRETGVDGYKIDMSAAEKKGQKPFPDPNWPKKTLDELIEETFAGRMILERTDPAWIRLIADVQTLS